MASKLRVGIIGCGGIGQNHVHGYLRSGRYEVVAISDLSKSAMDQYDEVFGGYDDYHPKHYANGRKMLHKARLDVVSIATWHAGHSTWTIAAAAHKPRAILCEKPMAVDLNSAAEMLVACDRNGVKLGIAHQRRFLPSYTEARELVAAGAIGDVELITSVSGSGLPNDASHHTDMYRYVLGDVDCEWVMGQVERGTDRYERNTRIEDRAEAVFGFEGGARAQIVSDLTPTYQQGCTIYGSEGMIELRPSYLRLFNADTRGRWEHRAPDGRFFKIDDEGTGFEGDEGGAAQAADLADWIEDESAGFRGEASHGYKALEMIHAVYESARLHERVALPLQTRVNPLDLMVESGHLPVKYQGRYDIRTASLRGENMSSDEENA